MCVEFNWKVEMIYKTPWKILKIIKPTSERVTFRENEKRKGKKIEKVCSPGSSANFASNITRKLSELLNFYNP